MNFLQLKYIYFLILLFSYFVQIQSDWIVAIVTEQPTTVTVDISTHDDSLGFFSTLMITFSVIFNVVTLLSVAIVCYAFKRYKPWLFVTELCLNCCICKLFKSGAQTNATHVSGHAPSAGRYEGERGEHAVELEQVVVDQSYQMLSM